MPCSGVIYLLLVINCQPKKPCKILVYNQHSNNNYKTIWPTLQKLLYILKGSVEMMGRPEYPYKTAE